MGGELRVDSDAGRGAEFILELPVLDAEPRWATSSRDGPEAGASADLVLAGRRALLVDDLDVNLEVLRAQLERWGMEVDADESAAAALQRLEGDGPRPDLVITDYVMPDVDGVAFAHALLERWGERRPPMILLSSAVKPVGTEALEAAGFSSFLPKPCLPDVLRAAVRDALTRPKGDGLRRAGQFTEQTRLDAGDRSAPVGLRVLVVDDNEVNLLVARRQLELLGIQPDTVSSGLRALEALRASPYELIFMDCEMPDLDGFETTRRIRAAAGGDVSGAGGTMWGRRPRAARCTPKASSEHPLRSRWSNAYHQRSNRSRLKA